MAVTPDEIRATYPIPVYNYRVEINGEAIAFTQVSGLSLQFETKTFKESRTDNLAGPRILHMPAQRGPVNLTLRKGVVPKNSVAALYAWISQTQINQIEKKDIFIRLLDEKGNPVISWKVLNAFPTKLDAPSFDAESNDAAVEGMELMADVVQVVEPG